MGIQETKTVNLVYDEWENNKPVPNGYKKLKDAIFFNPHGFFSFYLNPIEDRNNPEQHFDIQYYTIDDISKNPKKTFFYIICHASAELSGYLDRVDFPITDEVVNAHHKNKNLQLMFLLEHEGDSEEGIVKLHRLLKEKNIDTKRVYIINNNSKIYDIKKDNKLDFHVKKITFIDYSSTLAIKNVNSRFVKNKEGKFFMCRNKSHKQHRLNLLAHLRKENLLPDINWSFIPPHDIPYDDFNAFRLTFDDIDSHKDLFEEVYKSIKVDDFEMDKQWYDYDRKEFIHHSDFPPQVQVPENPLSYEASYINIVTESQYFEINKCIHITEKTFKPFYFYQIPLILASPNHVKEVKSRYNFDFFDDIIDHSYDSETDDRRRFYLFLKEIKRLNTIKDKIRKFYRDNQSRFELNKEKLLKVALDKNDDFLYFWNML